jgi:hypothetical protein
VREGYLRTIINEKMCKGMWDGMACNAVGKRTKKKAGGDGSTLNTQINIEFSAGERGGIVQATDVLVRAKNKR